MKKISFLNTNGHRYFEDLKKKVIEKGLEISEAAEFKVDCKFYEIGYYKKSGR